MIPLHLSISGFLSYRDPVDVDFSHLDLACISGHNGAGKSSLLDAITWALFGNARKKDDSLINSACKAAEVTFTFAYEGNVYRVQRTRPREKTGTLDLFIHTDPQACLDDPQVLQNPGGWKPLTEHAIRESEEAIRRTLRLDYDTFINASFFLQGKADLFSTRPPGERKKILSTILGLEIWETYRQQAADLRKGLEIECDRLDGQLQEIHAELAEEESRKAALADLQGRLDRQAAARQGQETALESLRKLHQALDTQRDAAGKQKERWEETLSRLQTLQVTLASRTAERTTHQEAIHSAPEIERQHQEWQAARQELQEMDEVAAMFREQEKAREQPRTAIVTARARLEQEKLALEMESRSMETSRQQLQALQAQAGALAEQVREGDQSVSSKPQVEEEIGNYTSLRANAAAQRPILRAEVERIKADIDRLVSEADAFCPVCKKPLSQAERAATIALLDTSWKSVAAQHNNYIAEEKKYEDQVAGLKSRLVQISTREQELVRQNRQYDQVSHQAGKLEESLAAWETGRALRLVSVKECLDKDDFAPEARQALAEVDARLLALGYDPARHDSVRQRELDGRESESRLRQLERARAALHPLEREIAGLQTDYADLQAKAGEEEAAWQDAWQAYESAAASAPALEPLERQLRQVKEEEYSLAMQVGAARQKVEILGTQRQRLERLNRQRDELTHRIGQHKALERAFSKDGVPAMLIEQPLPEIEVHANEILQRLTAGGMSVSFSTQREYRDRSRDDRKETLDIRIADSSGTRDYEMFSGGEAFRVNFAIRLALSRVLAQRAGARLQMLVIDEGFGSQDAEGRQRLIEAINSVRQEFKSILVITHMEELKDHFPNRIEVEKTERGSTIRVV